MGAVEFRAALDVLDAERASDTPDGDVVVAALDALKVHRLHLPLADDLKRLFAVCYWALDHFAEARTATPPNPGWRANWMCIGLIEATLTDEGARNRRFMQSGVDRYLALGLMRGDTPPMAAPPMPHVPLDLGEATALVAPYFARLEAEIAEKPYSHLRLAWNAFEHPVLPFNTVFENWLADLGARGIGTGNDLEALRQAMAMVHLGVQGTQCLTWNNCAEQLLPKLEDPHPMVAACAGSFIGALFQDAEARFVRSTPWTLVQMLDHLAQIKTCRRAAAGGFLASYGEMNEVARNAGDAFDLDDWVLAILQHPLGEPYVPGAQAFWFPVHEHYWRNPEFMHRLLDAGNDWVAYMCASEGAELSVVRSVLDRIIASDNAPLAEAARGFLARRTASE